MISREDLESDKRFHISKTELDWLFSKLKIYKYECVDIEIGRLRRFDGKKIISLKETINYKYLENPNDKRISNLYEQYCKEQENLLDNPDRSRTIFDKLRDDILDTEYNPQNGIIIINQYNIIEDGLHRSCILLKKHGPDFVVKVLKIKRRNSKKLLYLSPLYELKQAISNSRNG